MKVRTCRVVLLLVLVLGAAAVNTAAAQDAGSPPPPPPSDRLTPAGFRLVDSPQGEINFKLMSYVRYLNQYGLEETFTDAFGNVKTITPREDLQLQKVNIQFNGWISSRKLRYLAYVWTSNTSQGLGAQVVVGGYLQYVFAPYLTVGGGINALPATRTLEGTFPYWLPLDNRLIADEFFRPSYTSGIWARGKKAGVEYAAMLGNNLSQLGVDAGQLQAGLDTYALQLAWMPTTGEFGRGFGDYEHHDKPATRVGVHFTRSDENRQSQPDTEGVENSQIRTSDGNVIFTIGLFGDGIAITDAQYQMISADAGVKYRGLSLESEFYWRDVSNLRGPGTEHLPFRRMRDNGLKLEASAMAVPATLQAYVSGSKINGEYGDPWDMKIGVNFYPFRSENVRWNAEYMYVRRSPVGALSLPMPVGANGGIVHSSFMINF